jgi:hypothetical protein
MRSFRAPPMRSKHRGAPIGSDRSEIPENEQLAEAGAGTEIARADISVHAK